MAITPAALRSELLSDPTSLGYAPLVAARDDQGLADLLNLPRDGTNGGPAITVRRADIASRDIWEAIEVTDFPALSGNPSATQLSRERQYLAWLSGLAAIPRVRLLNDDGSNTPVIANLQAMFPGGSGTRARLTALAQRPGSRAEQLFGRDTFVTIADVAEALNA
jgi:hypothetical protein